jgi:heme O synthase-like polyprenyltransferase
LVGLDYAVISIILNGLFLVSAIKTYFEKEGYKNARRMFAYSIFYLFAMFSALVICSF